MNIKSIISKISEHFNPQYLQEEELKKLFTERFEINYKNFRTFCIEQKVNLPESSIWDVFVSQNISLNTQLLKACFLMDSSTACMLVTDSLFRARQNIVRIEETVELKIRLVK